MSTAPERDVIVVGGGITGLLTAARLADAGRQVTLLDAGEELGGQIRTVSFAGRQVDIGAESVFVASPAVRSVLAEFDLLDSAIPAHRGRTWLATPKGLRRLPAGVGPGGPTRLWPVLRSGLLSPPAMARAGLEPLLTRMRPALGADQDISVGDFVGDRFGRRVSDTFVDPLLGGIHAGDVNSLSLRACTPALVPSASGRRSMVLRRRPKQTGTAQPGPRGAADMTFLSFPDGMAHLIRTIAAAVPDVRTGTRVTALRFEADRATLAVDGPDGPAELTTRQVVLAIPAAQVAGLLTPHLPEVATELTAGRAASVANLLISLPATPELTANPALDGTGILVPSTAGRLLKAATFLSQKWPQLTDPSSILIRLSAGRSTTDVADTLTDEQLITGMLRDFAELTGVTAAPTEQLLVRWSATMPQQTVGHQQRIARIRQAISQRHLPVELAGSSFDGVGLAACFASAQRVTTALTGDGR